MGQMDQQADKFVPGIKMEKPVLTDKDVFPNEEVIFDNIGNSVKFWKPLFEFLHTSHPDFKEEWRYYKDGNSWLMKVTRKSSTVFWLSVIANGFRITFYFGDKAESLIVQSSIREERKQQFLSGKHYGKIRGITVHPQSPDDLEDIKTLIGIKLAVR
jgi:hypothetical protein